MSSAPVTFDAAFQTKIAAFALRDTVFLRRADGLVKPDQFADFAEGTLVGIALDYYATYEQAPSKSILARIIKQKHDTGLIRKDVFPDVVRKAKELHDHDVSDRGYVLDEISKFARNQAIEKAMLESFELKDKGEFDKIGTVMQKALNVGTTDEDEGIDFWEAIEQRTLLRKEIAAGIRPPTGISSGIKMLDEQLYHQGFGIGELTVFMGAAKAGKSTALGEFVKQAALQGKNCLYVSLEVASLIISERLDANLLSFPMKELKNRIMDIDTKIRDLAKRCGVIKIHQFPPGVFTPRDLRRLLLKYRSKGIIFDLVAVDYLDIMAPDIRTPDPIENSKSVWIDMRAIAMQENVALLTATQANRDGAKSAIIKATDVAEDYNKIRIADLVISINRTEEEKAKNECRLFFAASRNQAGEFTLRIKQDLEKMQFITSVLGIE